MKLYNKALHYRWKAFDIPDELLRFEKKYLKMERLNKLKIFTLEDLKNRGFDIFKKDLLQEWQNVLFYDYTIQSNKKTVSNYNNPLYWSKLLKTPGKSNFNKHKRLLKVMTLKDSNSLQNILFDIMAKKIDLLNDKGARIDHLTMRSILTPQLNIE
jgi:hypothetical protein